VKLGGLELIRVEIPFRAAIATAAGVHRRRSLLFVRIETDEGEGWGECAAMSEGTLVDPTTDQVERAIIERGVNRIIESSAARSGHLPDGIEVAQLFSSSPVDRFIASVMEMAVIDAELRSRGESLGASLGVGPGYRSVPVGAAFGIPPDADLDHLRRAVRAAVARGSMRVRIKIAPGWDVHVVAALRSEHPDLSIQVDANGSFRLDAPIDDPARADRLAELVDFGVVCVEQPLAPGDLVAHHLLRARLGPGVPICLDESLSSPQRVRHAIRDRSLDIACLKPGRLGGMVATRQAHAECTAAGVMAFVGGFFEAGLGRCANLALAAHLAQVATGLVGDVSDPCDYLEVDPCGYPPVQQGWVEVSGEPGVGQPPDQGVLDNLGAQRRWFPATYT